MDIGELLREQDGVVARRQVFAAGGDDNQIERMLRRRAWRTIHPGVYVDHTGVPTADQARMAAVLFAWPAALTEDSALLASGMRNLREPDAVQVAIDLTRRTRDRPGITVHRTARLDELTQWNRTPPRLRLEHAALLAASRRLRDRRDGADAVALLSDGCQQRMTTPGRLAEALALHQRLPGRGFLSAVLDDVASGAFSVLEHRYLTAVERPHRLPRARRQQAFRRASRAGFRDVLYEQHALVVELDGRLGHEWATDRWDDLERDLVAAGQDLMTIRAGWGQVLQPCRLAAAVARLLQMRGWGGEPARCPAC